MIPFPRILQYGNTVEYHDWYEGVDILAYDSLIFNASGFTDYTGKTVNVGNNPYGSSGVSPSLGTTVFKDYGTGIDLNTGMIGSFGLSGSFLLGDWSLDFWTHYGTVGAMNTFQPFYPMMCSTTLNTATAPYVWYQSYSNTRTFGLYSSSGNAPGSSYFNELVNTGYNHFAMQYIYSTKMLYVYVNGVLITTINSAYAVMSTAVYNGYIWGNYLSRSSSMCTIERYRLRTGNNFGTGASFGITDSDLYP